MGRSQTPETKKRISKSVKRWHAANKKVINFVCEKCGDDFQRSTVFKKGRRIHCEKCKRKAPHSKNIDEIDSILEFSKRTIAKILKRLKLGCSQCNWDLCVCDLHHILPKKEGGSDLHDNLTYLCPNCHRMAHNGYGFNFISLEKHIGDRWRGAYCKKVFK